MPPATRPVLALLALAGAACSRSPTVTALAPSPGPQRTVVGYITEIEYGNLSLRAVDGRSLIFSLRRCPVPVAELEQDMAARNPVRITYRPGTGGLLVPLGIEEPCPGPDCPPPYSQPPPSGL